MHTKRKTVIACAIACLGLLVMWLSVRPQVEIHGDLSKKDITDLIRLGHVERQRDLIDWSPTPQSSPPWDIRKIPYKWRRFRFNSAPVVRIDQMPDNKAEVTIGRGASMRRYQFVNTKQGWKRTPINTAFE
jgi:hypothetical protein